jgi:hypothetical protein
MNKKGLNNISIYIYHYIKGRERKSPPCSHHLGQVVQGCVVLGRQSCPTPPPSPILLARCEIADFDPAFWKYEDS